MSLDTVPTLTGYTTWIRNVMGVSSTILPDNSSSISDSFGISQEIVNQTISVASPILFTQATYNLGGDYLINITVDTPPSTYWSDLRATFKSNSFVPGLVNAANDEDTSSAILTPLNLQNITLGDLQNLKTPYGRFYLAIAQSVGTMWGLS